MIVIPPQDPNETQPDPAEAALGQLYNQFTTVQNLAEFHAGLRKRDALYEIQHQEMGEKPQDYENLHPKDFFNQFHRRADEDDKTIVSEAPYRIRQQLRDVLVAERDTARKRALETYKQQFIGHQLVQLDQDRLYYFATLADAANDQDRERYLTALIGRLKLSGDVGLLDKQDAEHLIENIPSDLDIFSFNREFTNDPAQAQRLLLNGAYPNIRPELREELVKQANSAAAQLSPQAVEPTEGDLSESADSVKEGNSETNKEAHKPSNDQNTAEAEPQEEDTAEGEDADSAVSGKQYAAAGPRGAGKPAAGKQPQKPSTPIQPSPKCPSLIGPVPVPGYTESGSFNWRACNDQIFIDAANNHNKSYGLRPEDRGYITPQLLKAWAIIENGNDKTKFLSDPFTVNNPSNWDDDKTKIAGLRKGEAMTPDKSARAALEWMRYKSVRRGAKGTLEEGLRNYSGNRDQHDQTSRKPYFDYHPGALHREWYPPVILGLEAKMLGMVRPETD
jgi:hypothetical protein